LDRGGDFLLAENGFGLKINLAVRKKLIFLALMKERLPRLMQVGSRGGICIDGFHNLSLEMCGNSNSRLNPLNISEVVGIGV
jgi:hypothetical protein